MLIESVILAAGLGTRMKSELPKVLHPLLGQPLLWWAVRAARKAAHRAPHVVVGPEFQAEVSLPDEELHFVIQHDRLGTGHALMQAEGKLSDAADLVLVTSADMPLLQAETLAMLIETQTQNAGPLTVLTTVAEDSRGFGRILRNDEGRICGIIEQAHATPEQLAIRELNVGAYCFDAAWLWDALPRLVLSPKGEYYLTDLVEMAASAGLAVESIACCDPDEIIGVNTRVHLAEAARAMQKRINHQWMLAGVTIIDPTNTWIEPTVKLKADTVLLPNTFLEGRTAVGAGCRIGPNSLLRDSLLADACEVSFSVVEGAELESNVDVGPFAHLRSGSHLCEGVHMGNFGEVKNSTLGAGVKMGHFSYIGDTTIGEGSNIGAGAITCNYDGERKHATLIGRGVFIGSDTMLVAPIEIGDGARTGAGAVVTRNVAPHTLAVGAPARAIRKLEPRE